MQADVTKLRLQRTRLRSEAEALEDALERQRAQARSVALEGAERRVFGTDSCELLTATIAVHLVAVS